ncbi:unnamed protein product [Vitrella brassicaformis CCMP3155]|uniref:Uncharacterized protein n=3 Tax=Vitrella brassicaformis TaxID=1169539 RepID=A0A0G4F6C7_VITBC|nr:unnamed protein product [Vitrella brassicaformis CCMP3155]|eukprot:CEM07671.1 unnamed protein product [Vitrella brassicaformis CCMP3155]
MEAPSGSYRLIHSPSGRVGSPSGVPFSLLPGSVIQLIPQFLTLSSAVLRFRRVDKHTLSQLSLAVVIPLLTRLLALLVPSLPFGAHVMVTFPQLPLRLESVGDGDGMSCHLSVLFEQLTRRLFFLERGGDWGRWKPHVEMLSVMVVGQPIALDEVNFSGFGQCADYLGKNEAVRQWLILSRLIAFLSISHPQLPTMLMDGNRIRPVPLRHTLSLPDMLPADPLFGRGQYDAANPPTVLDDDRSITYRSYSCMVAFVLFKYLWAAGVLRCAKSWLSTRLMSLSSRRARHLMAASGVGQLRHCAAVCDRKGEYGSHERLIVLGGEQLGATGQLAFLTMRDTGVSYLISVLTTESPPFDRTRVAVMRVVGEHFTLACKLWLEEKEEEPAMKLPSSAGIAWMVFGGLRVHRHRTGNRRWGV